VGKLAADEAAGAPRDEPRPLSVCLLRRPGAAFAKPRSSIDVQLPAVRTSLSKALLDQLELLADDLSQWSAALGRETDTDDVDGGADALKILGSRFFGTKHSISALSGSSDSTELPGKGDSAPALALSISEGEARQRSSRASRV
jgi:autophagy-related protein 2